MKARNLYTSTLQVNGKTSGAAVGVISGKAILCGATSNAGAVKRSAADIKRCKAERDSRSNNFDFVGIAG